MGDFICNSTELDQKFDLPDTQVFSCPSCCISSNDLFEQECGVMAKKWSIDKDECTLKCISEGYYYTDKLKMPQCVPGETRWYLSDAYVRNTAIKQTHNLFMLVLFAVMLGLFLRK
ncbi:hypothetical protein BDF21DRAFT_223060 [Thamnidium elegans]|nr:hypothetical protein BDF21DRAFT_223060 [Thamnidium elegans]